MEELAPGAAPDEFASVEGKRLSDACRPIREDDRGWLDMSYGLYELALCWYEGTDCLPEAAGPDEGGAAFSDNRWPAAANSWSRRAF